MAAKRFRILIVDRNCGDATRLAAFFQSRGHATEIAASGESGLEQGLGGKFDAVITGLKLEGMGGLQLVSQLHSGEPRLPVIMLTRHGTSETAIEAIKNGAYDYLTKPADHDELLQILSNAVRSARMMSTPVEIGQIYPEQDTIIGRGRAMTEIYKELGRIASKPVTVLIRGETGTGKELIARAIYQHGHRAHKPFIAINCAAIPASLLETELFGHERGAFTGADQLRIGRFEQAHNGTIFLDEIGDMDLALQAKLLRVLQEKQIRRVGGRDEIPVDVRIIAATHRDLEEMTETGTFRPDLYYRLNVATLTIPPLRKRIEDIAPLVNYFVQLYGSEFGSDSAAVNSEGMRFLQEQDWPGNVRQLQNVIRRALLSSRGYVMGWRDLKDAYESSEAVHPSQSHEKSLPELVAETLERAAGGEIDAAYPFLIEKMERALFAAAIKRSNGNQARAARWLGLSRLTMREKLHRYGLHPGKKGDR